MGAATEQDLAYRLQQRFPVSAPSAALLSELCDL